MSNTLTVEKIDPTDLSPLQREFNRGLMVAFINYDLTKRASLDVRTSTVFYDEDKDFIHAWKETPTADQLRDLRAGTGVRYWSVGC